MKNVIAIGLDGYEHSLGERLMASGDMPALEALSAQSARFRLDHGAAKRTGLAWEHFSTGLTPERAQRWSAVYFDPQTYRVEQKGTVRAPFLASTDLDTVVFDVPYFDLARAPAVRGITSWGAHDPGTNRAASPAQLLDEAAKKFGPYPATKWIYGHAWPSAESCAEMGAALVRAVETRSKMLQWLFAERLTGWNLGIVVVSELHSAIEALWHGVDETHPLHGHASARSAGKGLLDVHRAVDALIADVAAKFEDHDLVLFSMHGMGPNQSDVTSMLLLPELLYRLSFGKPFFREPARWAAARDGVPLDGTVGNWRIETPDSRSLPERVGDLAYRRAPKPLRRGLGLEAWNRRRRRQAHLDWMPAARYRPFWQDMAAFALPSYYDGSVRINLEGRERHGLVPLHAYADKCQEIVSILEECRDPYTGHAVVDHVEYYGRDHPLRLHESQGDLIVVWKGSPLALEHPRVGRIGPVPFRRTGGHTGRFGMACVKSDAIAPGDYGTRSSYDVAPTLLQLLGQPACPAIDGDGMLDDSPAREHARVAGS